MIRLPVDPSKIFQVTLLTILLIPLVSTALTTRTFSLNSTAEMAITSGSGLSCFDSSFAGIVYILPSSACILSWYQKYGDRIYFYVYADLEGYRVAIGNDFNVIASRYNFVIIVVPAEDVPRYYQNLRILDSLAGNANLRILYAIFPNEKYGIETDYLIPGTSMHRLVLDNMLFMSQLTTTFGIAVWYGWRGNLVPEDIRKFHASLPDNLKTLYLTWMDEEFVPTMVRKGLPKVAKELNIQVVTELYSRKDVGNYAGSFYRQIVVSGIEDATSASNWRSEVRALLSKASGTLIEPRLFGAWIFYDINDGAREWYRAYIDGALESPF